MQDLWIGFVVLVLALLALDLGVLNRRAHVISSAEALRWTALWVSVALLFNVFVYYLYQNRWCGLQSTLGGHEAAKMFLAGYVVEQTLSLDNVFVIALIFQYFAVPPQSQHRTLFWGIVGAMVFRGLMIGVGAAMIHRFEWTIYVFGGVLLLTAIKMFRAGDEQVEPEHNPLVKLARRLYPVTATYEGERFLTRLPDGRRAITPLLLVLLVIESTDVIFAVDSIPAIFGVTRDPFIVFTSNVFAILGLRSLYFVLAGMMRKFRYVKTSLVFVLGFIAIKMLVSHYIEIHVDVALLVLATLLGIGMLASWLIPERDAPSDDPPEQLHLPGMDDPDQG